MKYLFFVVILFVLHSQFAFSDSLYVAPFAGNKKAALSITFDDNLSGQSTYALPALNSAGLKGSFFVIAGQRPFSFIQQISSTGHEIGSHSWSHADLTLSNTNLTKELRESRDSISSIQLGLPVTTIAWPLGRGGGSRPQEAIIRDSAKYYYLGARNASVGPAKCEPANTKRYFQIGSILMDGTISASQFEQNLDTAIKQGGYQVLLYHAIEDPGYAMVPLVNFQQQLSTINSRADSLWIAPFGKVIKYLRQKNGAQFSNVNTSQIAGGIGISFDLTVNDTTPIAYTPEPVTVVYKLINSNLNIPSTVMMNASYFQTVTGLSRTCKWNTSDSTLTLDSVYSGQVQISLTALGLEYAIKGYQQTLIGSPFFQGLNLAGVSSSESLLWQILDSQGKVIDQQELPACTTFLTKKGQSGIYFVRVVWSGGIKTGKFSVLH